MVEAKPNIGHGIEHRLEDEWISYSAFNTYFGIWILLGDSLRPSAAARELRWKAAAAVRRMREQERESAGIRY
jgi:hypothetical protein